MSDDQFAVDLKSYKETARQLDVAEQLIEKLITALEYYTGQGVRLIKNNRDEIIWPADEAIGEYYDWHKQYIKPRSKI